VHLLVAKNCPKALEYLLNQTITTAVGQAPSSSTGAVESGAASNQPQAFSNRAIPGANTGTAAAAMFGSIAAVASAAASKRASTTATGGNLEVIQKGNEEEKDGVKGKEGTNKWSMAKAAYQQQQGKAREERKDAQGEGNTQEPTKEGGGKKKEDERNRQWFQEVVDVNLMSAQGETPLAIARALGHVACAVRDIASICFFSSSLFFLILCFYHLLSFKPNSTYLPLRHFLHFLLHSPPSSLSS